MSSCLYRGIEVSGQSRMRIAVLENENDTRRREGESGGGDWRGGRVVRRGEWSANTMQMMRVKSTFYGG